jgi:hypothetical protein
MSEKYENKYKYWKVMSPGRRRRIGVKQKCEHSTIK